MSSEPNSVKGILPGKFDNFIIAGPCGAETEEQVLKTAEAIVATKCVSVFRAGIWKPRTRPNAFEGVGSIGLKWLQQVKKKYNLPVCTEVANAYHTEEALKNGIDILWIGARTTGNPFSVQEIADVLKGTKTTVFIKNPVHPDIQLWIGAIERIAQAGIENIAAIHRGFHTTIKTNYRNSPLWEIPIELKTTFPQLPIICDPSHIAGNTTLLKEIAQRALDLGMNGLMIETHITPTKALSDARQQITPQGLGQLINGLIFRSDNSSDLVFSNELLKLRQLIDDADEDLIRILKKRNEFVLQIAEYKKLHNVAVFQPERWRQILETRAHSAEKIGLSPEFINKLCYLLHEESIRIQTKRMN